MTYYLHNIYNYTLTGTYTKGRRKNVMQLNYYTGEKKDAAIRKWCHGAHNGGIPKKIGQYFWVNLFLMDIYEWAITIQLL